jgi:hypothetical protein
MMDGCYVKTLQEPSVQPCALWAFEFVGIFWDKSLKYKFLGSKCLWPNQGCWLLWYGETMLILPYLIVRWKSRMISFEKLKQDEFLKGHITYESHMSISKYKTCTYAFLWPIEFCQIIVALGRIFSCSHIEITYTHKYKLTSTPGVTQNMPSTHQK